MLNVVPPIFDRVLRFNVHLEYKRCHFARGRGLADRFAENADVLVLLAGVFREIFDLIDEVDHVFNPSQLQKYIEDVHEVEALSSFDPWTYLGHSIDELRCVIGTEVIDETLCFTMCELQSETA